jgi:hypothetical protein
MRTVAELVKPIQEASQSSQPLAELRQRLSESGQRSLPSTAMQTELAMTDLWERMGELFGAKWLKQYGDTDSSAFGTWCQYLGDLSADQIRIGFVNMLKSFQGGESRYLPDAIQFREFCLGVRAFGLPPAKSAYEEACRAPSPKARQRWSHPAVYLAGSQTGWFELSSMPTEQILPRFEYNYAMLCQRVMAGEELSVPVLEALPETVSIIPPPERQISHLEKLRMELKV